MGDHPLLPISDALKNKVDAGVAGGVVTGALGWVSWPTTAAFLACVYTVIRIAETKSAGAAWKWLKGKFRK